MFSISYGATPQREHRDCGQRWVRNWYANNCRRGSRSQTTQILVILVIFSNFCPFHRAVAVEVCLRSLLWMSLGKKWLSILIKNDSGNGMCSNFRRLSELWTSPPGSLVEEKEHRVNYGLEHWTFGLFFGPIFERFFLDHFWDHFFFWPFFREKADHKYLRRGGM